MLTAHLLNKNNCYAWSVDRRQAPFFCKACGREVILKKGFFKIHHFAHKAALGCNFGSGESRIHYEAKMAIHAALTQHESCSFCEPEYKVGNVIPDVYAVIKNIHVAIEIQKSNLTAKDIINRTVAHHKNGLSVIWILPSMKLLKLDHDYNHVTDDFSTICRVQKWLSAIHALMCGRVYVWTGHAALVDVIHFDDFYRPIAPSDFTSVFERKLKDTKEVNIAPQKRANIAEDFGIWRRPALKMKKYTIPECFIWVDNFKKWWKKRDDF